MHTLIISAHPITCIGLTTMLSDFGTVRTLEICTNDDFITSKMDTPAPDIVFFDLVKCDVATIVKLKQIVNNFVDSKILVFTDNDSGNAAAPLLRMGVAAYVLKDESHQKILEAIKVVLEGDLWISEKVRANLVGNSKNQDETYLTDREAEVLTYLAQGMINKEIAQELCLSCRTVETYITQLSRKLSVTNRVEIVLKAIALGLVEINAVQL